jgi:N-acetylmuramoyl-L-alanine amidase
MPLLLVAVLLATTSAAAGASTRLVHVQVQPGPVVAVRLDFSAPVTPIVRSLPASDGMPERIYLDLPATTLGEETPRITSGAGALLRVRTGQFDAGTARVVLDLSLQQPYVVRTAAHSLTIELTDPTPMPMPTPALAPPPRPPEAPPARTQEVRRALVVVDAGHGGRDPGATGIDGVVEKTVTLALAKLLAERLPARLPVDVLLTRRDDAYVPIDERVAFATDATLFISLHANASLDPRTRGIEVFFGGGGPAQVASTGDPPQRFGLAIIDALTARLADSRTLVRPGGYGVLARNSVPSVLLEIGYLTNAEDAARIRDAAYQALVTEAVVDAVDAFLNERVES